MLVRRCYMQPKEPQKWDYKVTLETGRVVYLRSPSWGDFEAVSEIATGDDGNMRGPAFLREMFTNIILALQRKNGEFVDLTNRDVLFSKILSLDEAMQLISHPERFGLGLKKNAPKVELWNNQES